MDKFEKFYLTSLDQKMTLILSTMLVLDTNVKALQEKAQVWDIFKHHINAWTEHIKSVDQKIDLLKKSQDDFLSNENKLSSIEYTINHILNKVDSLNEKYHELAKEIIILKKSDEDAHNSVLTKIDGLGLNDLLDKQHDKKELINRLNSIQRQLTYMERENYKGRIRSRSVISGIVSDSCSLENNEKLNNLIETVNKLNLQIERFPSREIRQLYGVSKKSQKSLDDLLENVQSIDERTVRISDVESHEFHKLSTQQKSNEKKIDQLLLQCNAGEFLTKTTEQIFNLRKAIEGLTDRECFNKTTDDIQTKIVNGNMDPPSAELNITTVLTEEEKVKRPVADVDFNQTKLSNCHQLKTRANGIYTFGNPTNCALNANNRCYDKRYCDFDTDGIGWTVIQRRGQFENYENENFNRTWMDYRHGFGELDREFWFGNDFIHQMTYEDNLELRIVVEDWDANRMFAEYAMFRVDSEDYNYNLMIGGYEDRSTLPDSLMYHNDQDFSTFDRQNDSNNGSCCPCAESYASGWWFNNCIESNLNGIYRSTDPKGHNFIGIIWEHWLGDYSLKSTKIMVRPKDLWLKDADFSENTPADP